MSKTELYKALANSSECTYYPKDCGRRQEIVNDVLERVKDYNRNHPDDTVLVTIEGNTLELSNGQILRLPAPPKTGTIEVKSTYIKCAGVRIEKSDIAEVNLNDKVFYGITGSKITYR